VGSAHSSDRSNLAHLTMVCTVQHSTFHYFELLPQNTGTLQRSGATLFSPPLWSCTENVFRTVRYSCSVRLKCTIDVLPHVVSVPGSLRGGLSTSSLACLTLGNIATRQTSLAVASQHGSFSHYAVTANGNRSVRHGRARHS
jgi:hypothetical protein